MSGVLQSASSRKVGDTISVSNVAAVSLPITTLASGFCTSAPVHVAQNIARITGCARDVRAHGVWKRITVWAAP